MNRQRIFEIVSIAVLIVFIAVMSFEPTYSEKTIDEVAEAAAESFDVSGLNKIKKNQIIEDFDIDFSQVDSFVYYASDSIMNVSELMIVKTIQGASCSDIEEKIEKRVSEKQVLFEGYAPEQSALLKEYVLYSGSGFIFYAVGENANEAFSQFKSSVR